MIHLHQVILPIKVQLFYAWAGILSPSTIYDTVLVLVTWCTSSTSIKNIDTSSPYVDDQFCDSVYRGTYYDYWIVYRG